MDDGDDLEEESDGGSQMASPTKVLKTVPEIVAGINSSDPETIFECTLSARKMLSRERNPPIDSLIDAGIVPRLVQLLGLPDNPKLQFEAAWALTNIASGNSRQTTVTHLA